MTSCLIFPTACFTFPPSCSLIFFLQFLGPLPSQTSPAFFLFTLLHINYSRHKSLFQTSCLTALLDYSQVLLHSKVTAALLVDCPHRFHATKQTHVQTRRISSNLSTLNAGFDSHLQAKFVLAWQVQLAQVSKDFYFGRGGLLSWKGWPPSPHQDQSPPPF